MTGVNDFLAMMQKRRAQQLAVIQQLFGAQQQAQPAQAPSMPQAQSRYGELARKLALGLVMPVV